MKLRCLDILSLLVFLSMATVLGYSPDVQARLVRTPARTPAQDTSPFTEIVLEGGMTLPSEEMKDEWYSTEQGFSAQTGYELGVRIRQHLGGRLAISPSFHYVSFGSHQGVGDFPQGDDLAYKVQTSLYRYGLEFHGFLANPRSATTLYIIGGASLTHNRYRDTLQFNGVYESSVNAPAFTAGLGLKMRNIEVRGTYNFNRFDTSGFSSAEGQLDYQWDYISVTMGFAFGTH